jgi:hypothetical protein
MVINGSQISREIIDKFNNMVSIFKYDRLTKDSNQSIKSLNSGIKTNVPTPDDSDYKKGYITRYFVQSANDVSSYVYEVDKQEYSNLLSNPFYINVKLNWRLNGSVEQIRDSNSKSVMLASNTIKFVSLYLPNKLQFYKR